MIGVVAGAWHRFFFTPAPVTPLALLRIAYGVMLVAWTVTLAPDLLDFYGPDAVAGGTQSGWRWSLFEIADGATAVVLVYAVLLIAAVALTLGWHARIAAVIAFVALASFQRENPWVLNSGDLLVRHLLLYLALGASGAALSLDRRRRRRDDPWGRPERAVWPIRLIQLQLSAMYLFSVWAKVQGTTWSEGTAVGYALRIDDLVRFATPAFVTESAVIVNLLTYGTLALEVSLAILVWNRRLRPWVLGAGALLHIGIDLTITVGFFSTAVLVAYLAFLPPDVADRWVDRARAWRLRPERVAEGSSGDPGGVEA